MFNPYPNVPAPAVICCWNPSSIALPMLGALGVDVRTAPPLSGRTICLAGSAGGFSVAPRVAEFIDWEGARSLRLLVCFGGY